MYQRKDILVLPFVLFMVTISAYVLEAKPESVIQHPEALVDLSQLENGTYRGSCTMADGEYTVDITIEAHVITGITILNAPQRVFNRKCGLCEAMDMIREVIGTQSLSVDAYSGATQTTTAIVRAIEEALMMELKRQDKSPHTEAWR